ncbi:hypothetical protein HK097_000414 [Rhizophlyctis rosea]|uniref:Peptidase S74 domain-containing protein n=1 Tax=Rhizophlyctis rosea TaxID=64517 RepID=A0AAD5X7M6_9FUNG|nr:hypothetical protein HK097_000414 [Rhizophlyctis rosea]
MPMIVRDELRPQQIFYDWNDLRNSTGGGMIVDCTSVFKNQVVISGKGANGQYNQYAFVMAGRMFIQGEINVFSDSRVKQDILSMEDVKSYNTIKNCGAVTFKYKSDPAQTRLGLIAHEIMKEEYLKKLVSVYKNDAMERYVLNDAGVTTRFLTRDERASKIKRLKVMVNDWETFEQLLRANFDSDHFLFFGPNDTKGNKAIFDCLGKLGQRHVLLGIEVKRNGGMSYRQLDIVMD